MNNKFSRLEQLEASIDEMQGAIDWWRKESRRLEEGAFRAGFKLGEKHGKGAAGAWFTDIEHAFLRWKNHLNDLVDQDLVRRLLSGDCCDENNRDAASDILLLGDRIEELEAHHDKFLQEFWKTNAENERLRTALQYIAEESDAGRHDGLPEACPAHDEVQMWLEAREALAAVEESDDVLPR
jgi:hypothetical protein